MTATEVLNMVPKRVLRRLARLERLKDYEEVHQKHPEELARYIMGFALAVYRFPLISSLLSYAILGPMGHKVLVTERNSRLFNHMEAEEHEGRVGVTYGAGHLPGIDRHLRQRGFTKEGDLWLPAWEVDEKRSFQGSLRTVMKDLTETRQKKR